VQIARRLCMSPPPLSRSDHDRVLAHGLCGRGACCLQVENAAVLQAEAGVLQAMAAEQQAIAALGSAQSGVLQATATDKQAASALQISESNVPGIAAQLDEARFTLAQCKMTAPSDGYVVNWQVQLGTMLLPTPNAAAGTFVDTSNIFAVAVAPQNYLTNVEPRDEVALVLDSHPGTSFRGSVDYLTHPAGVPRLGHRDTCDGRRPIFDDRRVQRCQGRIVGLFAVKIRLHSDAASRALSMGSGGTAAIYTKKGKPVHTISNVTLRMRRRRAGACATPPDRRRPSDGSARRPRLRRMFCPQH
jgi:hypothetical protein